MKVVFRTSISLMFFVLIYSISCINKNEIRTTPSLKALFLIPDNYGANYFLMRDAYEHMGWEITQVSITDTCQPCPGFARVGNVPPIIPDKTIPQISDFKKYNALIIVPSPGNFYKIPNPYQDIIESNEALQFISGAYESDLPVYAMCAGVKALAAADIIKGKHVVGSPRFQQDYFKAGAIYKGNDKSDNPPLIDGIIITGTRGQTYNYSNAEAVTSVAEQLIKQDKKKKLNVDHIKVKPASFSSETLLWSKIYGGPAADAGRAVCKTREGGFIITGYTFTPDDVDADILVFKVDSKGNLVWKKVLGGPGMDFGNDCCITEDGYLITGYTTSLGKGKRDIFVAKIDKNGETEWEKTFGGKEDDIGTAVGLNSKDQIYICGYTSSFGKGEEDIYVINTDAAGEEIWSKTYGGNRMDRAKSLAVDRNDNIVIGATSLSFGGKNSDFYIFKINSSGDSLWSNNFNASGKWGHGFDRCQSMGSVSDKGFLLTGFSDCNDMMDVVVVKTDEKGKEEWIKSFGNKPFYDYGNSIIEVQSGGYAVTGITKSIPAKNGLYDNDIFVAEVDALGNMVRNIQIKGSGNDWADDMCSAVDGSLIIVGYSHSTENGSRDVCLLKIQ